MKKCKCCQENEVYKAGLCEDCLKELRAELKAHKQNLQDLARRSENCSEAEKAQIVSAAANTMIALRSCKKRGAVFYIREYNDLMRTIQRNCKPSPAAPAPATPATPANSYEYNPFSPLTPVIVSIIGGAIIISWAAFTESFPWISFAILAFVVFHLIAYSILAHLRKASEENKRIIQLLEMQAVSRWQETMQEPRNDEPPIDTQ